MLGLFRSLADNEKSDKLCFGASVNFLGVFFLRRYSVSVILFMSADITELGQKCKCLSGTLMD